MGDGALSELRLDVFGFVFQQFNLIPTPHGRAERRGRHGPDCGGS